MRFAALKAARIAAAARRIKNYPGGLAYAMSLPAWLVVKLTAAAIVAFRLFVLLASALDTTITNTPARCGVMRSATCRVVTFSPAAFATVKFDNLVTVIHMLSNPVSPVFGMAEDSRTLSCTLKVLFAALCSAKITEGHIITKASPVITPPATGFCPPVVRNTAFRGVTDASVKAALTSGARVVVAYGMQVRELFTAARLHTLLNATRVDRPRDNDIPYSLITFTHNYEQHHVWLVESPHPSFMGRGFRVHDAVALAELLLQRTLGLSSSSSRGSSRVGLAIVDALALYAESVNAADDDEKDEEEMVKDEDL